MRNMNQNKSVQSDKGKADEVAGTDEDILELPFLIIDKGISCFLFSSVDEAIDVVVELVKSKFQATPCPICKTGEQADMKKCDELHLPSFLTGLITSKLQTWVGNAFHAMRIQKGREYLVQYNQVLPVDFKGTGIVEINKKWGEGLQQFLEMKHLTRLSSLAAITNFMSNLRYFSLYKGQIYGTTGTLGTESDIHFLKTLYPTLSVCRIPTFNQKKLFEVHGVVKKTEDEWQNKIVSVVEQQANSNAHRGGRTVLVICEDINKAEKVSSQLAGKVPGVVHKYTTNTTNSTDISYVIFQSGDVIVATNLAGRGTDVKMTKEVADSGGLFVVLTFLTENARVELQAFGRTARSGKPGSAQAIVCMQHNPKFQYMTVDHIQTLKRGRDNSSKLKTQQIITEEIPQASLREDLFEKYCSLMSDITTVTEDKAIKKAEVAVMHEYWGLWLEMHADEILKLQRNKLFEDLQKDIDTAKEKSKNDESPQASKYNFIKF